MCGIYCYICVGTKCLNQDVEWVHTVINDCLRKRGPNSSDLLMKTLPSGLQVCLGAHVLHLQGSDLVPQPLEDNRGNCLLWNGEVFRGPMVPVTNESDTLTLSAKLGKASCNKDILDVLSSIQGPWSFIYLQVSSMKLWFGRDVLGRRSLLWTRKEGDLQLSSASSVETSILGFEEVPADGIYCLDLNNSSTLYKYKWDPTLGSLSLDTINLSTDCTTPVMGFQLQFPGFLKSPIDNALNSKCPNNMDSSINTPIISEEDMLKQIIQESRWRKLCEQFTAVLADAVKVRVSSQPGLCRDCMKQRETSCSHTKVAILFSGGVDSALLAALADRYIPAEDPIDLLNVAFEQVEKISRRRKHDASTKMEGYEVPDRISGLSALDELRRINPNRQWNFVEINVPKEELELERKRTIASLISPCKTVLDDSIGCAVWFAARGRGRLHDSFEDYISPARVVLAGMGADEQLAGYSRHAGRFRSGGWRALIEEVAHDVGNISSRNLGRDDRVISDHGRETRFPFLDEEVVKFLNSLPINEKADLSLPKGVGDKILIRLATLDLGLPVAAVRVKRAIQFGSRIAKTVETRVKGNDPCSHLDRAGEN